MCAIDLLCFTSHAKSCASPHILNCNSVIETEMNLLPMFLMLVCLFLASEPGCIIEAEYSSSHNPVIQRNRKMNMHVCKIWQNIMSGSLFICKCLHILISLCLISNFFLRLLPWGWWQSTITISSPHWWVEKDPVLHVHFVIRSNTDFHIPISPKMCCIPPNEIRLLFNLHFRSCSFFIYFFGSFLIFDLICSPEQKKLMHYALWHHDSFSFAPYGFSFFSFFRPVPWSSSSSSWH